MATAKSIVDQFYASYCAALASLDLQGPQSIVVALGGGADSQSVLDLTLRYRNEHPQHRYLAIHLDHYFHPKSPLWAEFLRESCVAADIEHIVEPLQVSVEGRQSKEAQGRDARYQRLAELTPHNAIILLGHHLSDQSETFFLQLKRGAGPKGLAAMAKVAPFRDERRLCRPLLGHSKQAIYAYAEARELAWIEDDTNTDTSIERNFLRHEVLPVLNQRWPQFEQTLARSAQLCAQQQALLDELLSDELTARVDEGRLSVAGFAALSVAYQSALIRLFLARAGVRLPSAAQLGEVIKQLRSKSVAVRWGDQQLRSHAEYLYLLPVHQNVAGFQVKLDCPLLTGELSVKLPDRLGEVVLQTVRSAMNAPQSGYLNVADGAKLTLALVTPGDKFKRRTQGQWHSVSRLLKKRGVPPWQRLRWPVLWVDGELAWVAEVGVCQAYQAAQQDSSMLKLSWHPPRTD